MSNKRAVSLKWRDLEKRAESNFFLSWEWIGNWLGIIKGNVILIEAIENNKVVGLGFFVEKSRKIFKLFPVKQWHLHRTGEIHEDQIWIEYNDFLLDSNISDSVRKEMVNAICSFEPSLHEVIIGLSTSHVINKFTEICENKSIRFRTLLETLAYRAETQETDLKNILSKNTRSQLKRSEKLLEQLGSLDFYVLTKTEDVEFSLESISNIHIERWHRTEEGSGFTNPCFNKFHSLMASESKKNIAQVSVLSLNSKPIGYLLNYIYKGKVYFYLSALTTFDENKIKVGLTLHTKAIQHYIDKGIYSYDFLGGDARYKKSLSNKQYNLSLGCFQRDHFLLKLESKFKDYKAMIKSVLFN
jgi:CelD/BcsL family acetyltransferase involved in cellulose biosynthesis